METTWPDLRLDAPETRWPRPDAAAAVVVRVDLRELGWRDDAARDGATPPAIARLLPLLDADERARAARFVFTRDRLRHVAAHALLRRVLARHLGHPADASAETLAARVRYVVAADGKPSLADAAADGLRFNLSHSGPWVLIAAAAGTDIGVDVEAHAPLPDLAALARTHFAEAENAALARLPGPERSAAFYRIWTRKEAWVKALGTGLAAPLHRFEVSAEPGDAQALRRVDGDPAAPAAWTLCDLPGIAHAGAACAVRAPRLAVRRYRLVADASAFRSRQ